MQSTIVETGTSLDHTSQSGSIVESSAHLPPPPPRSSSKSKGLLLPALRSALHGVTGTIGSLLSFSNCGFLILWHHSKRVESAKDASRKASVIPKILIVDVKLMCFLGRLLWCLNSTSVRWSKLLALITFLDLISWVVPFKLMLILINHIASVYTATWFAIILQ